jgi:hypothetical protein
MEEAQRKKRVMHPITRSTQLPGEVVLARIFASGHDGDLTIVFKNCAMDLLRACTTRRAERGVQFMVSQVSPFHDGGKELAVVNQNLGPSFDERFEPSAFEASKANQVIEKDKCCGRDCTCRD